MIKYYMTINALSYLRVLSKLPAAKLQIIAWQRPHQQQPQLHWHS